MGQVFHRFLEAEKGPARFAPVVLFFDLLIDLLTDLLTDRVKQLRPV